MQRKVYTFYFLFESNFILHLQVSLHFLGIARELKDTAGEACALLNLANCLSSRSEFAEAIPYYEQYLMLSQELADVEGEAKACHFLGKQ